MPQTRARPASRQKEVGARARMQTRDRLLAAAEQEFTERGYAAATVTRIAARAEVAVQTLYLAWGSKRELLRGYLESVLTGQPDGAAARDLPRVITASLRTVGDDPRRVVRQFTHFYRQAAERAALGWQLYRDAAATDPEVAKDWQTLQKLRHHTFVTVLKRIPTSALRRELTRAAAADTAWVIASPATYDLLVRRLGYTLDRYERWVDTTLAAALLA